MPIDVAKDDGVDEGKQRSRRSVEIRREVGGLRRQNVDVGDVELVSEGDMDNKNLRGAVIDA